MEHHHRKISLFISILCVLMYTFLFSTTIVFADDAAPPVSTEERAPSPVDDLPDNPNHGVQDTDINNQSPAEDSVDLPELGEQGSVTKDLDGGQLPAETTEETSSISPDEQNLAADEVVEPDSQLPDAESETVDEPVSDSASESLDPVPTDTKIVILVDNQVEPLATQAAEDAIANTDPVWCPGTAKPGDAGCTPSYATMSDLLSNEGAYIDSYQNAGGTIWITAGNVGDAATITINGSNYTYWLKNELTLQGGWDGNPDKLGTLTGNSSVFSVPLRILNWESTVSINDISVSNATSHGIQVTTNGDINLHNVNSSNNTSGHGAVLNNSAGTSGKVKVSGNSNFSGNGRSGLVVTSNGDIRLQDVIANGNVESGAILNNSAGSGTITLSGTNVFSGNTENGLRAISSGDITSETSLTTTGNGSYGAFFNTNSLTLKGVNTFSNNTDNGLHVRATGMISLENVTANDNQNNGAYLNNRGGSGSIALSGTNVFNHNTAVGLAAYSDNNITLSNVTAGANAITGNGSFGALLNNSTGMGNKVELSGTNIFNNNTSDGLRVVSAGDITINDNLTANNNGRYGAFLSNSAGSGNVKFTGTSNFNNNILDGLRVASAGNITGTGNLTANGNDRYGSYLDNTAGKGQISLSGTNTFNGNKRDGLHILSNGVVTTKNTTANTNGQHGFNIETTNGQTYLWHGYANDNGLSGVNVTLNQALYLLQGMSFSGNALGPVFVDGGSIFYSACGATPCGSTKTSDVKSINTVSVSNTRGLVELNCQLFAGTKLILPNGDFVLLPCPIGEAASLNALKGTNLPGALPSGSGYISGINFEVMAAGHNHEQVGSRMTVSFIIPAGASANGLAILFWNGTEWIKVDKTSQVGNRFEAQVEHFGIFVLVTK